MANQCKYTKEVLQVSYDSGVTWVNIGETRKGDLYEYNSPACGTVTEYRWVDVTGQYTCEGTTKYQKTKKQYSTDGTTWQDVSPAEYGKGNVIEYQSSDCGYDPPTPGTSGDYLTFVAIDDGTFKFSGNSVSYSLDEGSTWSTLASNTYSPTVYTGQKIMWKRTWSTSPSSYVGVGKFSSTGRFNVEGNVMSLVYGDNFDDQTSLSGKNRALGYLFQACYGLISAEHLSLPATTVSHLCYNNMFNNCTSLTVAPQLPATTLDSSCYWGMFEGCTSLTVAPQLPATTLYADCYEQMFSGCTSLTTAPQLPATTLANGCYVDMFKGCTSLTTAPQLPATTLATGCYSGMFRGCTRLTTAPSLSVTTLARNCYYQMFYECTSLTVAPSLPATTLANGCYYQMFYGCTSLTTAPQLPATTLATGCYSYMFRGCTSLTQAPQLPATTLADTCYYRMFAYCTNLNYIKCLATNISASDCTYNWLNGVSSSGTFVKASSMNSWTTGANGIPTNWTVQNA